MSVMISRKNFKFIWLFVCEDLNDEQEGLSKFILRQPQSSHEMRGTFWWGMA